jgi:hypothetical protein
MLRRHYPVLILLCAAALIAGQNLSSAAAPAPAKEPPLGAKVVAFCEQNKGQQVGNGQCSTLASLALKEAGAKRRGKDHPNEGDYTWGELVFTLKAEPAGPKGEGKRSEIRPGDIIQFRDVKFAGKRASGKGTYSQSAPHHTAIVQHVEDGGATIKILHQNFAGKQVVQEMTMKLNDLKEGWLRFYRPVPEAAGK